nr:MAG TPA: hypothetical protein [Caudoviricetes sp.]
MLILQIRTPYPQAFLVLVFRPSASFCPWSGQ